MANNIIKRVWNQNRMVNIEDLCGMAFQAESGGHTFEISGVDDTGAVVPLTGTVAGVFRRPDNADIALTGAAAGGVASVTLTDDCYAVPGRFGLTIYTTADGQKTAVYAAVGTVAATNGGAVAGDTPQDVVDLINAIEAAVATIPADYTDLMAAIAPDYSPSGVYPVGSYRWNAGKLYRSIVPITTAETWTAEHWTTAVLGDDVGDLKRSINASLNGVLDTGIFVNNSYVTHSGEISGYTGWSRTDYLPVEFYDHIIALSREASSYNFFYDSKKSPIGTYFDVGTAETIINIPDGAKYVIFSNTNAGMASLTVSVKTKQQEEIDKNADDIAVILSSIIDLRRNVSLVPNGTDYNTLTDIGTYKVETTASASSMVHSPFPHGHKLVVSKVYSSATIKQIGIGGWATDTLKIRSSDDNGTTWTEWEEIVIASDISTLVDTKAPTLTIADYTDYNDLGIGQYKCTSMASAGTMFHCPVSVAHRLFCFETYNSSNIFQILMTNRALWFRYIGEEWQTYEVHIDDYPSYYEEHLLGKETLIRNRMLNSGFRSDSFSLIADIHWGGKNQKHSPGLLKHIAYNTTINRLFMLGDYFATDELPKAARNLSVVLNQYKGIGFKRYIMVGNHDYNQSTLPGIETFSESQLYPLVMTQQDAESEIVTDNETISFYVDNKNKKIRYFFTNCNVDSSYDPNSYKWIFAQMESVPSGYAIAIFTHSGLIGPRDTGHGYAQYLTKALKAFNTRTSYTFDGNTFDYTGIDAEAMFVYAGHNHADQTFVDHDVMCIVTTCDAGGLEDGSLDRTEGTIAEQAFEGGVTVDITNQVVYLTRIGAGYDRIIHYAPVAVTDPVTLTTELSGTVAWSVEDSNVISISNGTVTKLASNLWSAVYAKADDGTTEVWNITT